MLAGLIHILARPIYRQLMTGLRTSRRFLFLLALLALPICQSCLASHIEFAAPGSGAEVEHYEATLPVQADQSRTFSIPADCPDALDSQPFGGHHFGSAVQQRLWAKVVNDCRYHALLHQFPDPVKADFVSNYDFLNAPLMKLPLREACKTPGDCPPTPSGIAHVATMFATMLAPPPIAPPITPTTEPGGPAGCRFHNGLFRGYLSPDPTLSEGWRCHTDASAPGYRVLSVDFADINGDGFQDAVLRLIPLGTGAGHAPIILPVTRFQAEGPFVLPP